MHDVGRLHGTTARQNCLTEGFETWNPGLAFARRSICMSYSVCSGLFGFQLSVLHDFYYLDVVVREIPHWLHQVLFKPALAVTRPDSTSSAKAPNPKLPKPGSTSGASTQPPQANQALKPVYTYTLFPPQKPSSSACNTVKSLEFRRLLKQLPCEMQAGESERQI